MDGGRRRGGGRDGGRGRAPGGRRRPGGAEAGKVRGHAVHPTGEHHDAHEHHEDAARLDGIPHHLLVLFEKVQQSAGEEAYGQKGQSEAQGIEPDEGKPPGRRGGRGGQQQHRGQGGPHAGSPGKGKGETQQQGGQWPHGEAVQPEGEAVFGGDEPGLPKNAQLVEAEEDHQDAARPGEEGLIPGEEPARGGKAQAQKEEGEGHPQDEEKGVPQHPPPAVADRAVRLHGPGTPGEIADIEGNQGQDTGGEKAQNPLEKDGDGGDAGLNGKAHTSSFLNMGWEASIPAPAPCCQERPREAGARAGCSVKKYCPRRSCPCPDPPGNPGPPGGGC